MGLSFKTKRLIVKEVDGDFTIQTHSALISHIPEILTPAVVKSLPPHFHGVVCDESAKSWLPRKFG